MTGRRLVRPSLAALLLAGAAGFGLAAPDAGEEPPPERTAAQAVALIDLEYVF